MKFFTRLRKLAARFDRVHVKAHRALRLPDPRFRASRPGHNHRNLRADQEERGSSCWILHAR